MATTEFQRSICRLIADNRKQQGEAYVAGGVALNTILHTNRISRDVDLFHDTVEALRSTWAADYNLLKSDGFTVRVLRERPAFVEAVVEREGSAILEWVCDSAFRFFPLVEHPELGLTLHPVDLATNKILAMANRVEARDWVDAMKCHEQVQPLGYLIWAACGKDPGFNPLSLTEQISRFARYSQAELTELQFDGEVPDFVTLRETWRAALNDSREIAGLLPPEQSGKCVLIAEHESWKLCTADRGTLATELELNHVHFHAGSIRGAFPRIVR